MFANPSFNFNSGDLNSRLVGTMASIGPAIFHGGISTLLAVVILADSISHVFQSYFKVKTNAVWPVVNLIKHFTSVIYNSIVVLIRKLPILQL